MIESAAGVARLTPARLVPLVITLTVGIVQWLSPMAAWWGVSGAVSVINILIWVGVGAIWWNIIGLM